MGENDYIYQLFSIMTLAFWDDYFFPIALSDIVRFVLALLMAVVVFTGIVQMWMLYAFSLGFGLVAGFAVPAGNSIVPLLVEEKDLQAGNSIVMGVGQLVGFAGPVLVGILIGKFSESLFGIGLAFGLDAVTFAVSTVTLWLMSSGGQLPSSTDAANKESIWADILAGLKHMWDDQALRLIFLVIAAVNFLFVGPILVGVPVLADQRLPEGAMAFGLLMSGFGSTPDPGDRHQAEFRPPARSARHGDQDHHHPVLALCRIGAGPD